MISTILWLPLLTAVCAVSSLRADLTVVERVEGLGENMETTMMFKAGRSRVDTSLGRASLTPISAITDVKSGGLISLMHAQKTYTKVPQAFLDASVPSETAKDGGTQLTPTGKKDTISGYAADEYTYSSVKGPKMTLWLSKAVPDYANLLKEWAASCPPARGGPSFTTMPGFPVRVSQEEAQPGHALTTTVVSISTKPIADSEFEIPADYKQVNMPNFPPPIF
jgi:hypothetical protein